MKEHRDEMDKIFKSKNDSLALEIWKKELEEKIIIKLIKNYMKELFVYIYVVHGNGIYSCTRES